MSRSHRGKGQTSLEFVVMMVFIMLVFAGFYSVFVQEQLQAHQEQEALMGSRIANSAAFEVKMALTQGDGYTRNVTLPNSVLGRDYNITINHSVLIVEWGDRRAYGDAIVNQTTGSLEPGKNTIKNRDGDIIVEQ